ncbi:Transposase InsO [Abditibacterium utsteinense]|uniref:Transposase InsO n=1 Tax=Abditibacterium utsteinense TaxID=1960156 RepID=A0A2S8SV17_9BACT|nr:Transposase InsO [Abditibacterium utsteinense]
MRYHFIQEHHGQFQKSAMFRVLGVSSSAYHRWKTRPVSQRQQKKESLAAHICDLFGESDGRYGSPRIHRDLQALGIKCSSKRVAQLMKEHRLVARKPRKFVVTTDSNHAFPIVQNVLNRKYQVENVASLNRALAGDITYVPTAQGWLYVAVVLDLKSRKVIGWSMRDSLEQTLVHEALEMALGQRLPSKTEGELLFHGDRGCQYAAHDYQEKLVESRIVCSMSRRGNCWDNAVVESFFATLKKQEVHRERYLTRDQAKASLFYYIEVFYNRRRRHSALGYLCPHDYEQSLLN